MNLARMTTTKAVIGALILAGSGMVWNADSASALTCTYSTSNGGHTANAHCPYNNSTGTFQVYTYLCSSQGCGSTVIYGNCTYYGNTSSVTTTSYVDPSRIAWRDCGVGG